MNAEILKRWAERLCEIPSSRSAAVLLVLGIHGRHVRHFGDFLVEPPPTGTSALQISERSGSLFTLEVTPDAAITPADLTACFGPGTDVVRVHWQDPFPLCYHVELPGTPYYCDLFAYFAEQPAEATPALRLMLRRQRAHPA